MKKQLQSAYEMNCLWYSLEMLKGSNSASAAKT